MSYGTNAPQGLQPTAMLGGASWNQRTTTYFIASGYASSIYQGDPVTGTSTGTIALGGTANTSPYLGVFWGVLYQDTSGNYVYSKYWPANTVTWNPGGSGAINATAFVIDSSDVIYNIQANTTIAQTNLNSNFNLSGVGTGSTISGQSSAVLDISTGNAAATQAVKLIGLTPAVNNSFGLTYNNGLVIINNHQYKGGTGTAGV
jgi:hypothetical protein